jgi:hypothetical protein
MKINDDHMYYGAGLSQIAEHSQFTAINAFKVRRSQKRGFTNSRCGFIVNDKIGIYLKYASNPKQKQTDYVFNFHSDHIKELHKLHRRCGSKAGGVFIGLVCVEGKQICCITRRQLLDLIQERDRKSSIQVKQYNIHVILEAGKSFRVNINEPRKKRKLKELVISRKDFPDRIFAD